MDKSLIKSLARWWCPFLVLFDKAWCKDKGGKWSPGKDRPETATAWRLWRRAAECSCALRLNSATDDDLASVEVEPVGDSADEQTVLDCDVAGSCVIDEQDVEIVADEDCDLLLGQHEHKLGKPSIRYQENQSIKNKIIGFD